MIDYRESFYSAVTDPESDFAKLLEKMSLDMMKAQLPDQTELWEKLTPTYPTGCKRVIISDDVSYPMSSRRSSIGVNDSLALVFPGPQPRKRFFGDWTHRENHC